ncbi:MAG TPA: hypothetical protein EYO71_09960, partial [Rhodospirillales bacterium]|nr:hypothetical protein [Rhodospirillales bacterium]
MVLKNIRPVFIGVAVFISGCSFSAESLLPTLTGEDPAGPTSSAQKDQAPEARTSPAPPLAPTRLAQNAPANNGADSGTFVGSKVAELRKELRRLQINVSRNNSNLQQLRANSVQSAESYQRAVAVVNSRLQVGTTPGNPVLVQRFNTALSLLNSISEDIGSMNKLTSQVTSDSTLAAFLSENTRAAFRVSGAMDEDHQKLAMLEDEVNRTVVLVERVLK